ncbi:MAG: Do family serine endopeptidase [Candidatus Aminicenantales bacterium]
MKRTVLIALISFLLGIFVAGLIFVYFPERNRPESLSDEPSSSSFASTLYASPSLQSNPRADFVTIAEIVGPAVLKIEAERVEKRRTIGFGEEWPFDDFWNRFFGIPREREQEYRSTAYGTGFFISPDGYILTNNHIVENAIKVTVFSVNRKEYRAKVVGTDNKTDLALLKVEGRNLPFAKLGDSARLKVGEWVLAIGNPLGMEHTVTAGIVSAKGRQLAGSLNVPDYQDFIQTDAAINRGNSGGPLVNMEGEVVGITSNILSPTGGNIGIGFAIPSNLAKKIVKQLKEKGRVIRGYLGVQIQPTPITEDQRKILELKSTKGALIIGVEPGYPAEKAGLKRYDVVVEINGEPVEGPNDLRFKIAEISPGTEIEIKIIRDGKEKTVKAKLVELESEEQKETAAPSGKDLGFSVVELTPRLANRLGLQTEEGLLITEVRRYSEADKQGLRKYDIILEANRRKIRSVTDLENILKRLESGDALMLLIRRETEREAVEFIRTLRIP